MEAFSLLKYWRGAGGGGNGGDVVQNRPISTVATIVTAVGKNTAEIDGDDDDDDDDIGGGGGDDDGPFFDLEFAVNEEDEAEEEEEEINTQNREEEEEAINDDDDDDEEEREFKFTLSSGSSNDRTDTNLALSPSDDLFFKGKLVPIESSSSSSSSEEEAKANDNNNNLMKPTQQQAQFPVSLLKSATKFRVFMLGLKKSKSNALANNNGVEKTEQITKETSQKEKETPEKTQQQQQQKSQKNQFFTVKLKVEEVPIVSLFSSRSVSNKSQKQSNENETPSVSTDEKRFAKEVVQKYLKMVKPLYVRVSKRYGERLKLSGQVSLNSSVAKPVSPPNTTETVEKKSTQTVEPPPPPPPPESAASSEIPANNVNKSLNFPAGLRVVCKHLGKSRSASSTAAVAPSGTAAQAAAAKRRDDSLLQQQDGIQSAILHCKRSFNAARDSESNLLSRCASDPSK
ncbi:probable membrane-associated kinase regulator 2 [Cannabis sativa]|uniref:Membrane-associated kinase regulator 2 n=1 Tax=Cannabis sativa TaxID=3483 RepID=A0A7J6IBI3_CANSA|nr:probable membrane-associated kinase regulator 2 [Cannabis sativa]KAF4404438.1 hypothetical protein G4B88_014894 [Cannabis sativa]